MIPKRMTTKEILLQEASRLFMDKGFQGTSTREIADNAGVTQPNVYHYFKTKEDIYVAVLEELSNEVKVALEELIHESSESLDECLLAILNYLRERHPANFSMMSHDIMYEISEENVHHLLLLWQTSYVAPLIQLFDRYITEDSPFQSKELTRYFYSMTAPFVQKNHRFYTQVSSENVIHLFVYGIYG